MKEARHAWTAENGLPHNADPEGYCFFIIAYSFEGLQGGLQMNIMTKEFEGHAVHTFEWNGKPCWIATDIVALFGYADASKTIQQCIEAEEFEQGAEYDILRGDALRRFKSQLHDATTEKVVPSRISQLLIFYEDGIYGFLQYTHKPIGIRFRKWIRSEVVPSIRQTGTYAVANSTIPKLPAPKSKRNPEASLPSVNNAARIMLKAMADAKVPEQERLMVLADMYRQAGIRMNMPEEPPLSQSENARIVTKEFERMKDITRNCTPEELDSDLKDIMDAPVSHRVKVIMAQMINAIKTGRNNWIN